MYIYRYRYAHTHTHTHTRGNTTRTSECLVASVTERAKRACCDMNAMNIRLVMYSLSERERTFCRHCRRA